MLSTTLKVVETTYGEDRGHPTGLLCGLLPTYLGVKDRAGKRVSEFAEFRGFGIGLHHKSPFLIFPLNFFLNKMKQGCFLYVDMSKLIGAPPEERDFKWAVWYLIIEAACRKMALPVPDPKEVYEELQMRSTVFIEKIRAILGMPPDHFLIVGFDQVGVLDSVHRFFDLDDFNGRVLPHNDFFGIVRELCELPHSFPIVVGKSEGLNVQNYLRTISNSLLKFIPLSQLDRASIEEHLERRTFKNAPVSSILCHQDCSIKDLSELLLEYTGGVPSLLVRAVCIILEYVEAKSCGSVTREIVESILNNPKNAKECVTPYLTRLEGLSDERKATMKKLILSHLYCVQFGLYGTLREAGQGNAYVFDLVTVFGLYHRQCSKLGGRYMYKVAIPKLLASFLEIEFGTDTLSALLFRTIRGQPFHFFYGSSCRILNGLVATKFYLLFALRHYENSLLSTLSQLSRVWSKWTWSFRLIQLHFMLCRLYIFR